nr:ribonuclease H-like domain, reverse transcriptase, RNA-dependent DNA polymerase [Tanacetum cinerariifolium]
MTRKGLVEGIPRINHAGQICDACLLGKHNKTPFPNQAKFRSKNPLDLVYGDLCGPISPATHSGKKLIFLLVDDRTRFMWAYFMTSKDQAFSTFKEFRQQIEMEMRMKLRMLRTYKGEAVKHAIYILNRVPTRALVDKTPYEALYNRKPNLKNLKIFGCTAYAKEASRDKKWIEDMEIELDSINKNSTWTLTTLPTNQKTIGLKWVFKTKRDAKGKIIKYKARLVAKGYVQEQGIDFDEVFAPVARIETIPLILALAAYHGWQVHHLDVKSAFLHGDLKEEVYVTQPEGFIQQENSGKVYKLTKALYGLRQAPRAWNMKLDQTLKSLDFKKCNLEQAVYTKRSKTSKLIVGVYVDYLIITGTPRKEIDLFKSQMEDKVKMSDLGLLAYYFGIEVTQRQEE